jgi:hypothetical protein
LALADSCRSIVTRLAGAPIPVGEKTCCLLVSPELIISATRRAERLANLHTVWACLQANGVPLSVAPEEFEAAAAPEMALLTLWELRAAHTQVPHCSTPNAHQQKLTPCPAGLMQLAPLLDAEPPVLGPFRFKPPLPPPPPPHPVPRATPLDTTNNDPDASRTSSGWMACQLERQSPPLRLDQRPPWTARRSSSERRSRARSPATGAGRVRDRPSTDAGVRALMQALALGRAPMQALAAGSGGRGIGRGSGGRTAAWVQRELELVLPAVEAAAFTAAKMDAVAQARAAEALDVPPRVFDVDGARPQRGGRAPPSAAGVDVIVGATAGLLSCDEYLPQFTATAAPAAAAPATAPSAKHADTDKDEDKDADEDADEEPEEEQGVPVVNPSRRAGAVDPVAAARLRPAGAEQAFAALATMDLASLTARPAQAALPSDSLIPAVRGLPGAGPRGRQQSRKELARELAERGEQWVERETEAELAELADTDGAALRVQAVARGRMARAEVARQHGAATQLQAARRGARARAALLQRRGQSEPAPEPGPQSPLLSLLEAEEAALQRSLQTLDQGTWAHDSQAPGFAGVREAAVREVDRSCITNSICPQLRRYLSSGGAASGEEVAPAAGGSTAGGRLRYSLAIDLDCNSDSEAEDAETPPLVEGWFQVDELAGILRVAGAPPPARALHELALRGRGSSRLQVEALTEGTYQLRFPEEPCEQARQPRWRGLRAHDAS